MPSSTTPSKWKEMLNKVPEITLFFWVIKVLCTTVGETAADFLNVNLNFGLTGTSIVTGVLLAIAIFVQFRTKKYIPWIYWLSVALVSVFGTLVTDNLTDRLGVPLETSTTIFAVLLGLTFLWWYMKEKTLSIHSIFTRRREAFYWLTILFTFALGTASGDLMAEGLGLGYLTTGFIVAGVIAIIIFAQRMKLNSILSFWIIYIMTRPLGASIGDYLSQPKSHGGLGLGATWTSIIFVGGILGTVIYLSLTKKDVIENIPIEEEKKIVTAEKGGLLQTAITLTIFLIVGITGYHIRHVSIVASATDTNTATQTNATGIQTSALGDVTLFKTITQDTLDKLNAGDQSGATARISDLEYEWDNAQSRLKSKNKEEWNLIDSKIDAVLRELRSTHPNVATEKSALQALLAVLR